uniref:Uncharacterized protein n=1 Tax=Glossina austeni TaxID=7395 RepID=A0A1A9VJB3_GLOAU
MPDGKISRFVLLLTASIKNNGDKQIHMQLYGKEELGKTNCFKTTIKLMCSLRLTIEISGQAIIIESLNRISEKNVKKSSAIEYVRHGVVVACLAFGLSALMTNSMTAFVRQNGEGTNEGSAEAK